MPGIYIHIPFCKTRCDYCAFYSTTLGEEVTERYVDRLCDEINERKDFFGSREVSTIYFGGGTPSRLKIAQFEKIFKAINDNFDVAPDAEITIEVNPDDITLEYASEMKNLPINRISMGVQSFDNELLKSINRRHSAEEAVRAFQILRETGFQNISIDLIYALPGENMLQWQNDISKILILRPEHISAYALSFEENTPLYEKMKRGDVVEIDEELYIKMYAQLMTELKRAGYEHYEISNFSLPGMRAKHNSSYWSGEKYLGIGAGAHSFNGVERRSNLANVTKYINSSGDVPNEVETLTLANKFDEMVMIRLRTREGIDLTEIEKCFGEKAKENLLKSSETYIKSGQLEKCVLNNREFIRLTENGIFISDEIISDLMNPD